MDEHDHQVAIVKNFLTDVMLYEHANNEAFITPDGAMLFEHVNYQQESYYEMQSRIMNLESTDGTMDIMNSLMIYQTVMNMKQFMDNLNEVTNSCHGGSSD